MTTLHYATMNGEHLGRASNYFRKKASAQKAMDTKNAIAVENGFAVRYKLATIADGELNAEQKNQIRD